MPSLAALANLSPECRWRAHLVAGVSARAVIRTDISRAAQNLPPISSLRLDDEQDTARSLNGSRAQRGRQ